MSAVSETIVREYFEQHGFLVRQQRKYFSPNAREDEEIDFLVFNPQARPPSAPGPFVLRSEDLPRVDRAIVVVKPWHTDTFSPGKLANEPEIFRFLEPAILRPAVRALGGDEGVKKILVVPALPSADPARQQSIQLLRERGVDAVLCFGTLLADLIATVQTNRNYQKSDLLQVLRLLKLYDLVKERQMELFKPKRRRKAAASEAGK